MSDDPDDPDPGSPPPPPDPLADLIERMQADMTVAYAPDVIAAAADLKRSNPVMFIVLLRDLKKFKADNPKAGFSLTFFNELIARQLAATSAVIGGAGDATTRLVELSLRAEAYFLNPDNEEVYSIFRVKDRLITRKVHSPSFCRWLGMEYYIDQHQAPGREVFKAALATIEARAFVAGTSHRLFPRVGHYRDDAGDAVLYLDRGSPQGDAIEIDHNGWRPVARAPVKFIRPEGAVGELPIPESGGNIDAMERLFNLRSRRDFVLQIGWVLGCYQPTGALAQVLYLGAHGSAKTSAMKRTCSLVDPIPHDDPLAPPREVRELLITAQETCVQAFDNVKSISTERSAALCRLSTGGGQRGRQLYTTMGGFALWARRPLIQTATRMVVREADLVDRTILIGMGSAFEDENANKRRPESVLDREYAALWPQFLGCILDAVAEGLRRQRADEPIPGSLPRLADFSVWTFRCEPGLGWPQGTILTAYREAIEEYARDVVELDPVASATFDFMLDQPDGWTGTVSELLALLGRRDGGRPARSHDWPRNAGEMHSALQDLSIMLFRNGLRLHWRRNGRQRLLTLTWTAKPQTEAPGTAGKKAASSGTGTPGAAAGPVRP